MTDGAWSEPCIGLVDTGVNAWHSHVRGDVAGCRLYLDAAGGIAEDDDFSDPLGHGTAVAGILREALPGARLFVVRVFGETGTTFPSLVARGILRAAAEGCGFINVSLGVAPGPGAEVLREACAAAIAAGCTLAAPAPADRPGWLPASLPGVYAVTADDALAPGDVVRDAPYRLRAAGRPRDLAALPREWNLQGHSFACARALAQLARRGSRP